MPKRLLPLLFLLLLIPAGIWAVATIRLDVRNRAANTISCWNRVMTMQDGLYWQTGCDATTSNFTNYMCKITRTKLTQAETLAYNDWVAAGRPKIPGCEPTAIITGVPKQPPTTGMPKPPPGCTYSRIKCIQAPCDPILICSTPVPCDGPDGSECTYGSCPPCSGRLCPMVMCKEQTGVCRNKQCVIAPDSGPIVIGPVTPGVGVVPLFTTSAPAVPSPSPTQKVSTTPQVVTTIIRKRSLTPTAIPSAYPTPNLREEILQLIEILEIPRAQQTEHHVGLADYNNDGVVDNYDLLWFIQSHE